MADPVVSAFNSQVTLLNKVTAEVKYRLSTFLANEKYLYDLEPRIKALVNAGSDTIKTAAKMLFEKEQALLQLQKQIETQAIAFSGRAGELKTKIDTDPRLAFIKTPYSSWGIRQYQILGDLAKDAAVLLPDATSIVDRLLTQNNNVNKLQKEVADTEKAAKGGGILPRIEGLLTTTVKSTAAAAIGIPVAIGATVLGAIFLLTRKK